MREMMTISARRLGIMIAVAAACGPAIANEEEVTDMEFLEYLGSWEESDEEWTLFDEPVVAAEMEKAAAAMDEEAEAPAEKDDES